MVGTRLFHGSINGLDGTAAQQGPTLSMWSHSSVPVCGVIANFGGTRRLTGNGRGGMDYDVVTIKNRSDKAKKNVLLSIQFLDCQESDETVHCAIVDSR